MKITVIVILAFVILLLAMFKKDMREFSGEISLFPPKFAVTFKKDSKKGIKKGKTR